MTGRGKKSKAGTGKSTGDGEAVGIPAATSVCPSSEMQELRNLVNECIADSKRMCEILQTRLGVVMEKSMTDTKNILETFKEHILIIAGRVEDVEKGLQLNEKRLSVIKNVADQKIVELKEDISEARSSANKASERDKKCNVVIHGIPHVVSNVKENVKEFLLTKLNVNIGSADVIPLGKSTEGKSVPYLVKLDTPKQKMSIFQNCYRLKREKLA
jgi:hypothetical protein